MYGQDEREVVPAGIRLDDRFRRTVLLDCAQDGGIAGIARLGKFKLLQEISYAPVPVLLGEKTELLREHRLAVLLGNAQYDIPATPVVDVVRKRAQGVENLFGIPPLLVLDSRPFHLPVVDEIVYVYG